MRHVVYVPATGEDEAEMMVHEEYLEGRDIQHLRRPVSICMHACT